MILAEEEEENKKMLMFKRLVRLLVLGMTDKKFGSHHSSPYNKKKTGHTKNKWLFLGEQNEEEICFKY